MEKSGATGLEIVRSYIYIESLEPHPLTFHPSRDFLSGDLIPIFFISRMAIVGKAGSDPATFLFVLFPSGLPTTRAVPVSFIHAPVGRRVGKNVAEGEHLAPDALAL
jgi:hypothetical protein